MGFNKPNAFTFILTLMISLSGCGKSNDCSDSGVGVDSKCQGSAVSSVEQFALKGTVMGAFEVEVDGKSYDDIEQFYSHERADLSSKVKAAGYEDYNATFDAKIGFKDLTQGMAVYLAPSQKRGFAAKTVVAGNDTFTFLLPKEAANDIYRIKAVKRISIQLIKGSESKKFCYNFAAEDLSVDYSQVDMPVVLSNFKTSITDYDCEVDSDLSSLGIPQNSDKTPTVIDSKEDEESE